MKYFLSVMLSALILVNGAFTTMAQTNSVDKPVRGSINVELQDADPVKSPFINVETGTTDGDPVVYSKDDTVRVSIVLDGKSTLEKGYSTENISANRNAVSYRNSLEKTQDKVTAKVEDTLGHEIEVKWNLTLAANIISAEVKYGEIEAIKKVAGVKDVVVENCYEPQDDTNTSNTNTGMIFTSNVWANGYTGAGQLVAIIDTGTNQDHISFQADALEYALTKDGKSLSDYDLLTAADIAAVKDQLNVSIDADTVYKNTKIPYAYNYIDDNYTTDHGSDTQGEHGSHVSGIAAANRYVKVNGEFVDALDSVMAIGVAPDAQILTMKVFGKGGGAYDSDYMAAIEDAIVLGADSVNLSLGSGQAGSAFSGTYQAIMDSLVDSDTVVTMSAGNSGAWYDTANNANQVGQGYVNAGDVSFATGGSPGSFINSLTIASADNIGVTGSPLVFNGTTNVFFAETESKGARMATIAGEYKYVYVDTVGNAEDFAAVNEVVSLEGKVVICNRGSISFYVKGNNAVVYKPAAVVCANNADGTINMALDDYTGTVPFVSITKADAETIKDASTEGTVGDIKYYTGTVKVTNTTTSMITTDVENATISSFSSFGGAGALLLKPELTTPGGNIYSVNGMTNDGFELMSGTSMAAPHAAGMAAVVAQYIEDNDLTEKTGLSQRALTNSLLMSTATPMFDADGYYYSLLQQGSGLANVYNATTAKTFIVMDDAATISAADGKVKVELGDDPARTGKYTYKFTVTNMSEETLAYELSTEMFTQALYTEYGVTGPDTDMLDATVTYEFENTVDSHDVNKDGKTDLEDVKALLAYITGKVDGSAYDLAAGEMDGVDGLSTYDAKLLLVLIKTQTEDTNLVLRANESKEVTVNIALGDNSAFDFENRGFFVEGFTYVTCVSVSDEGEVLDVEHSIPVYGFYGSWTDPSMYDASAVDTLYPDGARTPYMASANSNYLDVQYPGTKALPFVGNPYIVEDKFPADRLAISSETVVSDAVYTLIRNAGTVAPAIVKVDEAGNATDVLYTGALKPVNAPYYYVNGGSWMNTSPVKVSINNQIGKLGLAEGDKVAVGVYAVPEYNAMKVNGATSGTLTTDQFKELVTSGDLGDGAFMGYTFTVDNTAPTVVKAEMNEDKTEFTVVAKDNNYIAFVGLMDVSGLVEYVGVCPEQSAPGEEVTVTLDVSDLDLGNACTVVVADYAANETAKLAILGDGPIMVKKVVYMLTDELVDGQAYLIANTDKAGDAKIVNASGAEASFFGMPLGHDTDVSNVKVITDDQGTYILGNTVPEDAIWNAALNSKNYFELINNAYTDEAFSEGTPILSCSWWSDPWVYEDGELTCMYKDAYSSTCYFDGTTFSSSDEKAGEKVYLYTTAYVEEEIDPTEAQKVEVSPETATVFGVGGTTTLTAVVYPTFLDDRTVTWSSSDETVATVDANGVVTAVAEGTVTITAASTVTPSVTGSAEVTVAVSHPIEGVKVNAQVTDASGENFVSIDLGTFERTTLAEAGVTILGGGRDGDTIWAYDVDGDFDTFDMTNGYAGTTWFAMNEKYSPLDSTNFFQLTSTVDGVEYKGVGDMFTLSTTTSGYVCLYDTEGNLSGWNLASKGTFVAIAFAGINTEDGIMSAYYYAIDANGSLWLFQMEGAVDTDDETGELALSEKMYLAEVGAIDGFTIGDNVRAYSATYVGDQTGEDQFLLADTDNKLLYIVTPSMDGSKAELVCAFEDIDSISCLYNDLFDATNASPVTMEIAKSGSEAMAMESINMNAPANVVTGSTEAIREYTPAERKLSFEKAPVVLNKATLTTETTADDQLTVTYTEDEDAGNGLVTVTYNPEEVTFVKVDSDADFPEVSVDEENGVVTFAYVTFDNITAGETIATFYFTAGCEDSTVTVSVKELNDDLAVTDETEVTLEGTGHDYQFVDFTWSEDHKSATANFVCANDETHTLEVEATVTVETTDPTCEEAGKNVYTATAELDGQTYTDTYEEEIESTGHDYQLTGFTWSADHSSAKANFVCNNDKAHELTVDAVVTTETTDPTCEEAGKTVYTATAELDGQTYTDTYEEEIESIGHDYQLTGFTWSKDNKTATATFVCANDEEHTLTLDATVTVEETKATAEKDGKKVFTATVELDGQTYTETKEVTVPYKGVAETGDFAVFATAAAVMGVSLAALVITVILKKKATVD